LENNPDLTLFTNRAWRDEFSAPVVVYDELYVTVDRWANATDGVTIKAPEVYDKNDTRLGTHITNYLVSGANGENWLDLSSIYPERRINTFSGPELKPKFAHVVHGHARAAPPKDRLQLSLSFLAVVILCNAVKLGVMLWVLLLEMQRRPLSIGQTPRPRVSVSSPKKLSSLKSRIPVFDVRNARASRPSN
jgi:hypothetical protein